MTRAEVEAALDRFRGEIAQVPPMVSAIRQGGRRLYELARAGQTVERAARAVTISRLVLTAWEPPVAALEVDCSPGTYIRSLAHDLGQALGVGAHLAALERTASGTSPPLTPCPGRRSARLDEAGTWAEHLIPPDRALAAYPALHLDAEGRRCAQRAADQAPPGMAGLMTWPALTTLTGVSSPCWSARPVLKPHKVFAGAGGSSNWFWVIGYWLLGRCLAGLGVLNAEESRLSPLRLLRLCGSNGLLTAES